MPAGAGICLNASFLGCSTCPLPGAMLKVRLCTEEQLRHWVSKNKLPLSPGMGSSVSFSCSCHIFDSRVFVFFFLPIQVGFQTQTFHSLKKKKSKNIHGWWLPVYRLRINNFTSFSQYFGISRKFVVVLGTFVVLKIV